MMVSYNMTINNGISNGARDSQSKIKNKFIEQFGSMNISELEKKALLIFLYALDGVLRWKGNQYISKPDTNAEHTLSIIDLTDTVFVNLDDSPAIKKLHQEMKQGGVVHEGGEIIDEIMTNTQAHHGHLITCPDELRHEIERQIFFVFFDKAVKLAKGDIRSNKFFGALSELRQKTNKLSPDAKVKYLSQVASRRKPRKYEKESENWLQIFDSVECEERRKSNPFTILFKIIDKLESLIYMTKTGINLSRLPKDEKLIGPKSIMKYFHRLEENFGNQLSRLPDIYLPVTKELTKLYLDNLEKYIKVAFPENSNSELINSDLLISKGFNNSISEFAINN